MISNDYQNLAGRTLLDKPIVPLTPEESMIVWNSIGLAEEAGEVAGYVKKTVFHRTEIDLDKLKKELGDCMWYIAALCTNYNLSLSDIMEGNIEKLKLRHPDGFSNDYKDK
jgi:NTP pyrophosphatase (non-canonical NTP hydrolase)